MQRYDVKFGHPTLFGKFRIECTASSPRLAALRAVMAAVHYYRSIEFLKGGTAYVQPLDGGPVETIHDPGHVADEEFAAPDRPSVSVDLIANLLSGNPWEQR